MDGGRRPEQRSDDELVAQARADRNGEAGRRAISELLQRYAGRVHQWCLRYVRDQDLAYDLAQDVLLRAYQGLAGFDGRAPFSAWLFVIVRNRCLRAVRKPRWTADEDYPIDELVDPASGVDERMEQLEEEAVVLELIEQHLDPTERDALLYRCVERMPVEEITRLLGIEHASGARGVLQTARRKLRAALARKGELR